MTLSIMLKKYTKKKIVLLIAILVIIIFIILIYHLNKNNNQRFIDVTLNPDIQEATNLTITNSKKLKKIDDILYTEREEFTAPLAIGNMAKIYIKEQKNDKSIKWLIFDNKIVYEELDLDGNETEFKQYRSSVVIAHELRDIILD